MSGVLYGVWTCLLHAGEKAGPICFGMLLEADLHGQSLRHIHVAVGSVQDSLFCLLPNLPAGFFRSDADGSSADAVLDSYGTDLTVILVGVVTETLVSAQKYGRYSQLGSIQCVHQKFAADLPVKPHVIISQIHSVAQGIPVETGRTVVAYEKQGVKGLIKAAHHRGRIADPVPDKTALFWKTCDINISSCVMSIFDVDFRSTCIDGAESGCQGFLLHLCSGSTVFDIAQIGTFPGSSACHTFQVNADINFHEKLLLFFWISGFLMIVIHLWKKDKIFIHISRDRFRVFVYHDERKCFSKVGVIVKARTQAAAQMTEGPIWKRILFFALPLMVGNLFQQLYNTVDSIVVGNFVGKEALAAVGTVDPVINTFIGFFLGMSAGAGVVISQYYGAKDDKKVSRAVHTTITMTLILCVACTAGSLLALPALLKLIGTPADVYPESRAYLTIYFAGMSGLLLYNMGSGILRAAGDSRRPLYFLIFSTLLNIVFDLLFVAGLRMGVAGAAYATILAQGLSALLVLYVLTRETESYRIRWRELAIDPALLGQIVKIGLPSALQMMITSFSNVFVQSYINHFGSSVMAGWSSYGKVDKICLLPMQSIALSVTTFTGQNLGAGKVGRCRKGTKAAVSMSLVVAVALIIPIWIFATPLVALFNRDPEVLKYGTLIIRLMMPFYVSICFNQVYSSTMQGAGNTKVPVIIMMCSFILFRQVYLFIASRVSDSFIPIALGYPLGWIVCSISQVLYYRTVDLEKYRLTK